MPQGSVLSVTLFSLKMNGLAAVLKNDFHGSLYFDDFVLCCRSGDINCIELKLQLCLGRVRGWADVGGLGFPRTEATCVHFCSGRKRRDGPRLQLEDVPIGVVKELWFLGVVFG